VNNDGIFSLWINMAEATLFSRTLANTRATIAKPSYLEEKLKELIQGH